MEEQYVDCKCHFNACTLLDAYLIMYCVYIL
jgi:hypothetical protein